MFDKGNSQEQGGSNNIQGGGDVIINNNYQYITQDLPTHLSTILLRLSESLFLNENTLDIEYDTTAYGLDEKIQHNGLVKYKKLINLYGTYSNTVNSVYDALNEESPSIKNRFLLFIRGAYKEMLVEMSKDTSKSTLEIIQTHSDTILDMVCDKLTTYFKEDPHKPQNPTLKREDIDNGIKIIVCSAFMDCKILEKPK
jgi:hypothetical protein